MHRRTISSLQSNRGNQRTLILNFELEMYTYIVCEARISRGIFIDVLVLIILLIIFFNRFLCTRGFIYVGRLASY